MILLDTSGLLAAIDSAQYGHSEVAASLADASPPLLLSPFVLAELDYLLASRVSEAARMRLLAEVGRGAYQLQPFAGSDVQQARDIIERHAALGVSLADASIVVLAAHHNIQDVLSTSPGRHRVAAWPRPSAPWRGA